MGFWILLTIWLASVACIPHMLLLNKRPTATLAWLWAILLIPGLGAALYLAIGVGAGEAQTAYTAARIPREGPARLGAQGRRAGRGDFGEGTETRAR